MARIIFRRTVRNFTCLLALITFSACGDESIRSNLRDNATKASFSHATKPNMKNFPTADGEYPFITAKDAIRREIMNRAVYKNLGEDSGFPGNEDPALLVDNPETIVTNITKMEELNLRKAELSEQPWSDYYWPTYRGMLGIRYNDSNYPESENWLSYYRYVEDRPAQSILRDKREKEINELSPSEKYDLLVGNPDFTLTKNMWSSGKVYFDEYRKVESWFGLCHGWAAASFMNARPAKAIKVRSPVVDTDIILYPSDIKGLLALLWANGESQTRFLGGRCDVKRPATDDNGRLISSECFDVNPGAWHIAAVNQLGIQKRSFIIDASYDYEVWNQPVFRYRYEFFNPNDRHSFFGFMNRDSSVDLDKAMVRIEDMENDRFKKYRDERTKYIVGVKMEVSYASEVSPSRSETNGPDQDSIATASYRYDLELDANKNIIGGEWYEKGHPDFIWVPLPTSQATSLMDDKLTGTWDGNGVIPKEWNDPAKQAADQGQPLAKIVHELVRRAQKD